MRVWVRRDTASSIAESPATHTVSLWLSSMQQDDLQLACKSIITQSVPSDLLFGVGCFGANGVATGAADLSQILVPLLCGDLGGVLHARTTKRIHNGAWQHSPNRTRGSSVARRSSADWQLPS